MNVIVDLCVVPLGVGVSVSAYVAECVRVLRDAGLATHTHAYGTNIEGDWDAIEEAENEALVTSLAMICPFAAPEKQALLEAEALPARAEVLTSLLEMSAGLPDTSEGTRH